MRSFGGNALEDVVDKGVEDGASNALEDIVDKGVEDSSTEKSHGSPSQRQRWLVGR